ncbi:28S ribosomal protein S6 [Durusdinium trenchii]|uniref:Mitochondrial n=1 Tax=Durusdinium trenchii TaxID=1381693 RepID=A0ABP0S914_9DINO
MGCRDDEEGGNGRWSWERHVEAADVVFVGARDSGPAWQRLCRGGELHAEARAEVDAEAKDDGEIAHYMRLQDKLTTKTLDFYDVFNNPVPPELEPLGVTKEQLLGRMHVLTEDAELKRNASAFQAIWQRSPIWRVTLYPLTMIPGVLQLADIIYDRMIDLRPRKHLQSGRQEGAEAEGDLHGRMAGVYVLMCKLRPSVGPEGLLKTVRQTAEVLLREGAIIRNVRNNGVRTMAYTFYGVNEGEKTDTAQVFTMDFIAPRHCVALLTEGLNINTDVLRHTTLLAHDTLPRLPRKKEVKKKFDPEEFKRSL